MEVAFDSREGSGYGVPNRLHLGLSAQGATERRNLLGYKAYPGGQFVACASHCVAAPIAVRPIGPYFSEYFEWG